MSIGALKNPDLKHQHPKTCFLKFSNPAPPPLQNPGNIETFKPQNSLDLFHHFKTGVHSPLDMWVGFI